MASAARRKPQPSLYRRPDLHWFTPVVEYLMLVFILSSPMQIVLTADAQTEGFWLDIPFARQDKNLCGAASVWMVLQYWRKSGSGARPIEVPPFSQIADALRSPESKGVLGSRMKHYLASLGYRVFVFKGQWEDVETHISKGRPLIAALGNAGRLDHYVVIAGWNRAENVVLVNDPARRKLLKLDLNGFRKAWEQTSCWALLALPPAPAMPVTVDGQ